MRSSLCVVLLSIVLLISSTLCVDPPETPTKVYLKIFMNQLNKIDGVEQSFSSDFYLTLFWEDSRIPMDVDSYSTTDHWNPVLEFINALEKPEGSIDDPYSLLRGGDIDTELASLSSTPLANQTWVKCDQRYVGDFLTNLKLQDFPFDKQNAVLSIESALYNTNTVKLRPHPSMYDGGLSHNVLPKGFTVTEWDILERFHGDCVNVSIDDHYYPVFDEYYSSFTMKIAFQRQPNYYLWKIGSGVILLVYMCIMVIALNVDEADRMMGTLTVFLALVSFTFITSNDVPKVAYQTRIDVFITFSFFTTFCIMLMHCLNYLYNEYLGEDNEHTSKVELKRSVDLKGVHGFRRFLSKFRHRYAGVRTRKIDAYFALATACTYALGVAIIFGREAE